PLHDALPISWEVFLGTHPSGFYADLARAQIEALNKAASPALPPAGKPTVIASLPPDQLPSSREPTSKEALEWGKVKDSADIGA
ncbi:hypothetical protein, partial [Clostridium sp. ZBS14]|uniref:hypothetical protein n=1 Tax=Clostridium sp. ZBS14 TaxID=2949970 RepID=UPI0020794F6D